MTLNDLYNRAKKWANDIEPEKVAKKVFMATTPFGAANKVMNDQRSPVGQFFKPTEQVRIRDFVREVPNGVWEGVKQLPQQATRFAISAFETPNALRTGQATGQFYNTPFGRLNSFQSEAQNRVQRGDPLWKAIGNPALDTFLGAVDFGVVAKPILGAAKQFSHFGNIGKEIADIAGDLSIPLGRTMKMRIPARMENVSPNIFDRQPGMGTFRMINNKLQKVDGFDMVRNEIKTLIPEMQVDVPFEFQSKTMRGLQRPGLTIKEEPFDAAKLLTGKGQNIPKVNTLGEDAFRVPKSPLIQEARKGVVKEDVATQLSLRNGKLGEGNKTILKEKIKTVAEADNLQEQFLQDLTDVEAEIKLAGGREKATTQQLLRRTQAEEAVKALEQLKTELPKSQPLQEGGKVIKPNIQKENTIVGITNYAGDRNKEIAALVKAGKHKEALALGRQTIEEHFSDLPEVKFNTFKDTAGGYFDKPPKNTTSLIKGQEPAYDLNISYPKSKRNDVLARLADIADETNFNQDAVLYSIKTNKFNPKAQPGLKISFRRPFSDKEKRDIISIAAKNGIAGHTFSWDNSGVRFINVKEWGGDSKVFLTNSRKLIQDLYNNPKYDMLSAKHFSVENIILDRNNYGKFKSKYAPNKLSATGAIDGGNGQLVGAGQPTGIRPGGSNGNITPEPQKVLAMPKGYASGEGFQMSPGKTRTESQLRMRPVKVKGKEDLGKTIKVKQDYTAKPGQEPQNMGAFRRFFTGGDTVLRRAGQGGKKLYEAMNKQRKAEDLLVGRWNVHIDTVLEGLDEKQIANVDAVLRGEAKPMDAKTAGAWKSLRNWFNSIGKTAEEMKFQIQNSTGIKTPFKMRENYAPQMYNFTEFQKGKMRETALQHLVDSGQARNLGEATKLLDNFIKQNAERRFGNLEKAREIDLPGFERDPRIYAKKYAQAIAKRFTEVEHYGMKDDLAAKYINQIAQEGGDYNAAQNIFDFSVKGAPQNKVVNAINQYNLATQLDLSFITNATQSLNTMTETGILNTLKGAYRGFTKKGKTLANSAGVYDDFIHVKETGVDLNKIVKGVMWPFQQVERFNRRTAANAGMYRAQELVARHQKEATEFTTRKLIELGLDPDKLAKGKLLKDDLVSAAYEMAKGTQFKVDTLDVPTAWKKPVGKLATQFQSFSFMQTKFIRDKVIKEALKGNYAPVARFIPLAIGASWLAQKGRNLLTGRDEKDLASNTDVRAWDKYLKAFGDFASSKIIQGEFLYDTYKNPYNTSLKKVTRTLSSIGGPTVGKVGNVLTGLESLTEGMQKNEKAKIGIAKGTTEPTDAALELKRFAAGEVPFVGEFTKNKVFGYPKSKYSPEEKSQFAKEQMTSDAKVVYIKLQKGTIDQSEADKELAKIKKTYENDVAKIELKAGTELVAKAPEKVSKTSSGSSTNGFSKEEIDSEIKKDALTGKYHYFDVNDNYATADTEKEARKIITKKKFEASDKNFLKQDGYVYRKDAEGKPVVMTESKYNTQLYTAKLSSAKRNENIDEWLNIAEKKFTELQSQLEDPNIDELDKVSIQDDIDALVEQYQKYRSYGGFTKPKAGKKPKKLTESETNIDIPSFNKPATPKLSSPKLSLSTNGLSKPITLKSIKLNIPKIRIKQNTSTIPGARRLA